MATLPVRACEGLPYDPLGLCERNEGGELTEMISLDRCASRRSPKPDVCGTKRLELQCGFYGETEGRRGSCIWP